MNNCPFCEITDSPPAFTIYSNSSFIVLPDRESLGLGHCLIIPKIHAAYIYDLAEETYNNLFILAKKLSLVLKTIPREKYYRSFANTGGLSPVETAVAYASFGTGIQHAHLHLVPHNNPDILLNPLNYIKKLSAEELVSHAEIIKEKIT